ncbi:MAG: LytR C-terminal domain-containing protein [Clostridiales bacterium]|nr:LytR C-terminal domain-containing protein [Clostridiales bacterium]
MARRNPRKARRIAAAEPPQMPSGWRSTRRGSRARKQAERAMRAHAARERASGAARTAVRTARNTVYLAGMSLGALALGVLVLWLSALAINGIARWNAERIAAIEASPEALSIKARDNLLVIAVTEGRATGFLALRVVPEQQQVFGIAIPDAAFIEVPGQGFTRAGDSFTEGPDTSLAAVTNFFSVPFTTYLTVDSAAYQAALTGQDVRGLFAGVVDSNLEADALERWRVAVAEIPVANVALVPMPVKPLNVGTQTYFEPQREEIADLVEAWWGVAIDAEDRAIRVIVYNGAGVPGIAGEAAGVLIRSGFRVIDTKNADTFDYTETQIIVEQGDESTGNAVRDSIGVGAVLVQPSEQRVADVIVIIGADFTPPGSPEG